LPVPASPSSTTGWPASTDRAGLQRSDGGRGTPGATVQPGVFQPLHAGEPGLVQPAGAAAVGALIDLGGQHLGQERAVGAALVGGVIGDLGGLGGDGGQVQLAAGDPDGSLGGRFSHRLHAPTAAGAATWPTAASSWCRGERVWSLASRTSSLPSAGVGRS